MSDKKDRAGLGKVIYSVEKRKGEEPAAEETERAAEMDVEEADKESFPASDPPGFSGGTQTDND